MVKNLAFAGGLLNDKNITKGMITMIGQTTNLNTKKK